MSPCPSFGFQRTFTYVTLNLDVKVTMYVFVREGALLSIFFLSVLYCYHMSGIIPPGPELQPKVQLIAAKLSKLAKNQADDFVKKLLNSPRASEVFFADPKDMFYPYYLEQLNLYRNNTAMADAMIAAAQKEKDAAATKASATSASHDVSATSVSVSLSASGTVVRNGGNVNEEVLRNIEQDAKMCAEDPHPDVFTINRDRHAVEILPKHLSFMSVTAQYAA
ncbi:Hypothetical protein, putative, partial [Bodo saltans]